jgi:hypothetical protein
MARKKKEENLEVTEEFVIEDVSDVQSTNEFQELEDLNTTEVESIIEDGSKIELTEEEEKSEEKKSYDFNLKNVFLPKVKPKNMGLKNKQGIQSLMTNA